VNWFVRNGWVVLQKSHKGRTNRKDRALVSTVLSWETLLQVDLDCRYRRSSRHDNSRFARRLTSFALILSLSVEAVPGTWQKRLQKRINAAKRVTVLVVAPSRTTGSVYRASLPTKRVLPTSNIPKFKQFASCLTRADLPMAPTRVAKQIHAQRKIHHNW